MPCVLAHRASEKVLAAMFTLMSRENVSSRTRVRRRQVFLLPMVDHGLTSGVTITTLKGRLGRGTRLQGLCCHPFDITCK
jgi:hypothetical protein